MKQGKKMLPLMLAVLFCFALQSFSATRTTTGFNGYTVWSNFARAKYPAGGMETGYRVDYTLYDPSIFPGNEYPGSCPAFCSIYVNVDVANTNTMGMVVDMMNAAMRRHAMVDFSTNRGVYISTSYTCPSVQDYGWEVSSSDKYKLTIYINSSY
jgi:hypothetical protein